MREENLTRPPLSVAVCDDNPVFRKYISNYLKNYLQKQRIDVTVSAFETAEDLRAWEGVKTVNALFLDVELPGIDGFEVAREIHELNSSFVLVIISEFLEHAPAGYAVGAFRYVLKDRLDSTLDKSIDDVLHSLGYNRDVQTFNFITGAQSLYTDEISYIESHKHAADFFGIWGDDIGRVYMKISDIYDRLPPDEFIISHKSYLVNLQQVEDFCDTYFTLKKTGKIIPISQSRQSGARKAFYMYTGKKPKRKGRKPKAISE